jgi:hypothetical protein
MVKGFDGANFGGNLMTGVEGRSVCVRSTTRTELLAIAAANCVITVVPDIIYSPRLRSTPDTG